MGSPDENVSILVHLGLSQLEAKVYLALFRSKNPTAWTISKISGISRPDVYRVLGNLEETGFVEKIVSKPQKFHPIPAEEVVSTLLERRKRQNEQLQKEASRLAQALQGKTANEETDDKCGFILISGRNSVHSKAEKMLRSAQECICCLGFPRRIFSWLSFCSSTLEEVLAKKVDCRVIMPKFEEDVGDALKSLGKRPNFSVRLILERPETAFSIWDRKEILIDTSAIDTAAPAPVLWSDNKCIVTLCQEYFEYLWLKAKKTDLNV
jgi:sugar-specific transcriptional regulator TrmB